MSIRRRIAGVGRGGACVAFALAVTACASSSSSAPEPSPTLSGEVHSATPDLERGAVRWGYDPSQPTGERDDRPHFTALPAGYRIETFATGLEQPTALAFTPDGRLLVTEQAGRVRVIDEEGDLDPEPYFEPPVFYPAPEDRINELGLVGIAVDPDFEDTPYIYIYYTTEEPERRTVFARFQETGFGPGGLEEIFSVDVDTECCHIAGSIRFLPDETLFVTVGDHLVEAESQDPGSPIGSILRIERDGSAPPDNPFVDRADADPRVYAYGLRNPFDIAIDPATGHIWATENGFLGQDAIIEVTPGANYGWPGAGLDVPLSRVAEPLIFFHESTGPAGIEFYRGGPLEFFEGTLLFCQFHQGGALHMVTFSVIATVQSDSIVALGCTSDLTIGPDGFIYFLDYVEGVVYRISGPAGVSEADAS